MPQPIYLAKLTGWDINSQTTSCTGEQLVVILRNIELNAKDCKWFAADISLSSGKIPKDLKEDNEPYPVLMGETIELIELVSSIDQFTSGVFFALKSDVKPIFPSDPILTEDDRFRYIRDSVFEIRAFDTTYFEIYSARKEFLAWSWEVFHVEIEYGYDNNK